MRLRPCYAYVKRIALAPKWARIEALIMRQSIVAVAGAALAITGIMGASVLGILVSAPVANAAPCVAHPTSQAQADVCAACLHQIPMGIPQDQYLAQQKACYPTYNPNADLACIQAGECS